MKVKVVRKMGHLDMALKVKVKGKMKVARKVIYHDIIPHVAVKWGVIKIWL